MSANERSSSSIGIFLIGDFDRVKNSQSIIAKLQEIFNISVLPKWSLEYRLYVTRPELSAANESTAQHVLWLSHVPKVLIGMPEVKDKVTSFRLAKIPATRKGDYQNFLSMKNTLIWTPKSHVGILNGMTIQQNDYTVRMGEVRAVGTNQGLRSFLIAIEVPSKVAVDGSVGKEEEERVRFEVMSLVKALGTGETKEAWGFGGELDIVRAWCDIMKSR
ncbi:hypothetical protein BT63DRAFT_449975 [Microthyrium microscopicum]|uniref:Mediator of RNA polymerase II transcription subunit 20 n=1 Tax=Microthyrium microscopicum TaxID=703497 RepID=A0A6A6UU38_9PEZI|nr:hypothetical protein BT63DRAFT_449975 [Microthyrium microscopicum]